MNDTILQKYGLVMQKTPQKSDGIVSGNPIANYLYSFRHPDDPDDSVSDLDLAISDNFSETEDPDYGDGLGNHWFAEITPNHFELWQEGFSKTIIPLTDWKEIRLSWKACLQPF